MIYLFDVDSTVTNIEGLNEMAKWKGMHEEVSKVTEATMNGDMSFEEAFPKKVEALSPSHKDLDDLGRRYLENMSSNFSELSRMLRDRGAEVGLLTGNFHRAVRFIVDELDIDKRFVFTNRLEHDSEGDFVAIDREQILMKEDGKRVTIEKLKKQYPSKKIVFVGDSHGDMLAGEAADEFVGYGGAVAREKVRENAEQFIYDFSELL